MGLNWFERVIGTVAPRAAVRRVAARQALETLARGYDGSARGRMTDGWRTASSSADTEIAQAGGLLRDRMRDLVRNNPHAAKAIAVLATNIVGSGIMPRAASRDPELNKHVDALFERWSKSCDADGQLDFYGLQTLVAREMVEAGEVLVRRRMRRAADRLPVPMQLQVIEADLLDGHRTGIAGGRRQVQGIEFDEIGRRKAYWMFSEHPGSNLAIAAGRFDSHPVPAAEIAHVYEKQRTQVRGVPWGTPVIRALRNLDDYELAEIVRKKTEACVAAFVIGDDEDQEGITLGVTDPAGRRIEGFEPGMIAYVRGGKEVKFNQPAATGGYGDYKRASLHTIAAGFRIPYELLTGDLSQVNYSSIRAGLVEFRRLIEAVQWQIFIPLFCEPAWQWFCDAAWIAGEIPEPSVAVEWTPPRFEAVDALKDATADMMMVRTGTMSLKEAIARQGRNPDAMLDEIAETNALLDKLGIILDSDPRKVSRAGLTQARAPGAVIPGTDGDDDT